jgi:hypothetical protein
MEIKHNGAQPSTKGPAGPLHRLGPHDPARTSGA